MVARHPLPEIAFFNIWKRLLREGLCPVLLAQMAVLFQFLQSAPLTAWAQSGHCYLESHSVETQKWKPKDSLRPRKRGARPVWAFSCVRESAVGDAVPPRWRGQDPSLSNAPGASDKRKQRSSTGETSATSKLARRPHSRSQLLTLCWELTCLLPGHSLVGDESASSASPSKATASLACFTGPRFQALELKTQLSPCTPAAAGGSHACDS